MPEVSWQEADWVQDLTISGNLINTTFGGIFVGLVAGNDMGPGQFLGHRNISILNNTIANANYAPILVTSAQVWPETGCICMPTTACAFLAAWT